MRGAGGGQEAADTLASVAEGLLAVQQELSASPPRLVLRLTVLQDATSPHASASPATSQDTWQTTGSQNAEPQSVGPKGAGPQDATSRINGPPATLQSGTSEGGPLVRVAEGSSDGGGGRESRGGGRDGGPRVQVQLLQDRFHEVMSATAQVCLMHPLLLD